MSIGPMQIIVVIGVVILLIWAPKQIPKITRNIGEGIKEFKSAKKEVKDAVKAGSDEITNIAEDIKKEVS